MKTFAISAMGRSGTKFLASVMHRSPSWKVQHEPQHRSLLGGIGPHPLVMCASEVQPRFDRERNYTNYGEVNSYLRHVLPELQVDVRGVILRHPQEILLSAANWKPGRKLDRMFLDQISIGFWALDQAMQRDPRIIQLRFYDMTRSPEYLQQQLLLFGISDLTVTEATLQRRVNASRKRFKRVDELPSDAVDYYTERTGWYSDRYFPE